MGDVSAIKLAKEVSADDYDAFDSKTPSKQITAQSSKKDFISKEEEEMEADSKAAQSEMKKRVEEEKFNKFDGTFHIDGKRITPDG